MEEQNLLENDHNWMEIISDWRESGLTVKEWIQDRDDISYSQFIRNRIRLFPTEKEPKETTWSAITMDIPFSKLDVLINDCRIEVRTGFDEELLREIVEVLKRAD
ncbi:hypothetical protein ACFQPF_05245 [Fictibacillus iocasae]|uniref:Uncharacterized protein n=1 Tax=Fictibacillus iocasae TaxID=2715437 RepID=A0ABW2NKT0_9BACL